MSGVIEVKPVKFLRLYLRSHKPTGMERIYFIADMKGNIIVSNLSEKQVEHFKKYACVCKGVVS